MSPAAYLSVIRQVSSTTLIWSSTPVVLHLSLPSPSLKPPHRKPRHSTLKGLKTPTIAAPATPETMPACQAAQVPSQPHLLPPKLTSPAQLPLQPPTHPRRPPGPHGLLVQKPPWPPSARQSLPQASSTAPAPPAAGRGVGVRPLGRARRGWIRTQMCRSAQLGFVVGG